MKKNSVPSARLAPKIPVQSVPVGIMESVTSPAPFAELMLHPEKLDGVLKNAPVQIPGHTGKVSASAQLAGNRPAGKSIAARPRKSSKTKIPFHLQAHAKSVQIAGDFNDWGKSPIDMVSDGNGKWSAVVPLEPGQYAYRFIVDGQWRDDPNCTHRVANAFGTENSVIKVG